MSTLLTSAATGKPDSILQNPHVQTHLDRQQDDDSRLDLTPDTLPDETPETYLAEADYQTGVAQRTAESVLSMLDEALRNARAADDVGGAAIIGYVANQIRQIVGSTRRTASELHNARELIRTPQPGSPFVGLQFSDASDLATVMGAIKKVYREDPRLAGYDEKCLARICREWLASRHPAAS